MGETPEEPESSTGAVVVVNGGDGGAPAPPSYVTSGELDAKLETLGTKLTADLDERFRSMGERVSSAQETAWQAQDQSADAQAEADLALAVADAVAEQVEPDPETDVKGGKDSAPSDEDEAGGDGGPKSPERREPETKKSVSDRKPWKGLFPNG